jgi:uncharacterized protein YgbK (DUF1537 family)
MDEGKIQQSALFAALPPEWAEDLLPAVQQKVQASGRTVLVLDDDPTGTQTVHNIPVLTEWGPERLQAELNGGWPAIYLLTNSRSLPQQQAQALNAEIASALREASKQSGQDFVVVSRSDSTLRGHFPAEVQALAQGLQETFSAWLLIPFFVEGGRYTASDVHYVAEGEWLVPAGETEFAKDKAFGYRASNLREWVAEKTNGAVPAQQVESISLDAIRNGGSEAVTRQLLALPEGCVCIVNAVSYRDLEVFVLGLLDAEAQGRRYLYRSAASFVRVRAGIAPRPLLTSEDLGMQEQGAGLIMAGSYVPKTSTQIDALLRAGQVTPVEVNVRKLLSDTEQGREIERVRREINTRAARGEDTAVFTSRELVSADNAEASLAIGKTISDSLVNIVRGLKTRPRYLLAKGGITSSDIATRGLGIRRALVLGQILPGVPVWQSGPESRFPGLPYIVFPGNVGNQEALAKIADQLKG